MKRLTERDEYGNADIIALSDVMPELYAGLSFAETNALTEALNRLAAYEETGYSPEEVNELALDKATTDTILWQYERGGGLAPPFTTVERDGEVLIVPLNSGHAMVRVKRSSFPEPVQPCPVCGKEPDGAGVKYTSGPPMYRYRCCTIDTGFMYDERTVIREWNKEVKAFCRKKKEEQTHDIPGVSGDQN